MAETQKIDWPVGDLYDCRDSESLIHESPEEAIEELIDAWLTKDCDVAKEIQKLAPVTVAAYVRQTIGDSWFEAEADRLLEVAAEDWGEEFDSEGDNEADLYARETKAAVLPDLVAVLKKFYAHSVPWNCERVGEVTLSSEQVVVLMREHRPDWFDSDEPKEPLTDITECDV